jgi:predicted DsbA family dithiol-disulfide isomerase
MERKYDSKDIICPVCCHIYYAELRNAIVKYGYTFSLGVEKMSYPLQKLWKKNMLL